MIKSIEQCNNISREYKAILEILKYDLFDVKPSFEKNTNWYIVYKELSYQGILGLSEKSLNYILKNNIMKFGNGINETLPISWENGIKKIYKRYDDFLEAQKILVKVLEKSNIKYIVFKGIATSSYYPISKGRILSDIDFIVKPNDFNKVNDVLLKNGFQIEKIDEDRHNQYCYNKIRFELHNTFAIFNEKTKAKLLNDILISKIDNPSLCSVYNHEFYTFPKKENGLMILQHINHHMKNGIGFKNYLDWALYVNKYMDDDFYDNELRRTVEKLGLEKLIKVLTKVAIKFLGVKNKNDWCMDIDDNICDDFIKFLFKNGSFGIKNGELTVKTMEVLSSWKRNGVVNHIQTKGTYEWNLAKKYPIFKPFAFLYKIFIYIKKTLKYKFIFKSFFSGATQIKINNNYMKEFGGVE